MPRYAKEDEYVAFENGPERDPVGVKVGPACDSEDGHWYCDTHMTGFEHNTAAMAHYTSHEAECRLVWVCHVHGPEATK